MTTNSHVGEELENMTFVQVISTKRIYNYNYAYIIEPNSLAFDSINYFSHQQILVSLDEVKLRGALLELKLDQQQYDKRFQSPQRVIWNFNFFSFRKKCRNQTYVIKCSKIMLNYRSLIHSYHHPIFVRWGVLLRRATQISHWTFLLFLAIESPLSRTAAYKTT